MIRELPAGTFTLMKRGEKTNKKIMNRHQLFTPTYSNKAERRKPLDWEKTKPLPFYTAEEAARGIKKEKVRKNISRYWLLLTKSLKLDRKEEWTAEPQEQGVVLMLPW